MSAQHQAIQLGYSVSTASGYKHSEEMSVYNQIVFKNTVEERYLEVYAVNTTVL